MTNRVPDRLTNFNCYKDGSVLLGLVDVELPSLEAMSEEVKGAGIMGSYETPTIGHFISTTVTLNFRTPTRDASLLHQPVGHLLEFRASLAEFNGNLGILSQKGYRVVMRAMPKNPNLGKMEVGASMETSMEMEVTFLQIFMEGVEVLMLDKPNFIYRVNGFDWVKEVRDKI